MACVKTTRRGVIIGGAAALVGAGVFGSGVLGPGGNPQPGRSRARRVEGDSVLPASADVVVVGGGDIGAASAYYLARKGLSVVLCEKGEIGAEASCRSVGWVYSLGMPPGSVEVTAAARPLWHGINAELGIDTGFRPNGLIMEIPDEESRAYWVKWLRRNAHLAPAARILDAREIPSHVTTNHRWHAAIHDPTDGCAEPGLVAPAFAEAARRHGARVMVHCAVRGFETAGGRITSVVTEKGPIRTSRVVLAGGAWSSLLLGNAGLQLPTATVFSWCSSFYGVDGPDGAGYFSNVTWRRQIDGGYTTSMQVATAPVTPGLLANALKFRAAAHESAWVVRPRVGRYFFEEIRAGRHWELDEESPFERRRILEPEPNPELVRRMLDSMRSGVPAFRELKPGPAWGGAITITPDELPVVGVVPTVSGLVVATAFDNGLAKTPAVGIAIAELINGETPRVPLNAMRYDRFGS